ncbi:MAG: hypothetical protein ACPGJR_03770 [Akkermansiaceae bacterium]
MGQETLPTLKIIRNFAADDVEVLIGTSSDLSTWESGQQATALVTSINNGDGTVISIWRSIKIIGQSDFFRIRVKSR